MCGTMKPLQPTFTVCMKTSLCCCSGHSRFKAALICATLSRVVWEAEATGRALDSHMIPIRLLGRMTPVFL